MRAHDPVRGRAVAAVIFRVAGGLRSDVPEILGRAVREVLLVDADLPGDDPEALLEFGKGRTLGDLTIRDLIEEGRRY